MIMLLNTNVGKLQFGTPLLLASGHITETPDFFLKANKFGCSGMVTRSLKKNIPSERLNTPTPRYAIFDQESMLNCEWGNSNPWTNWFDRGVSQVKNTGCPIIISLSGRNIDDCCDLIKSFDKLSVNAYEINISCSHSGSLHGDLNIDMLHLRAILKKIRNLTATPIWIKLSYSNSLIQMAEVAEQFGANAIVCTNSIGPGLLIDTKTAKPKLGIKNGAGGLTGKAIFPIALWCVSQLYKNLDIPIIGCGGIFTADQTIQMLMAGASAVQLYTAPALKGPDIFKHITSGLQEFLDDNQKYGCLKDIVGIAAGKPTENQFTSPVPIINAQKCTGCGICLAACAFKALELLPRPGKNPLASIKESCVSCNACAGVCPPQSKAIQSFF
jgi:dihydroorotate dehydrogenase (NAD+) catalytic subunit